MSLMKASDADDFPALIIQPHMRDSQIMVIYAYEGQYTSDTQACSKTLHKWFSFRTGLRMVARHYLWQNCWENSSQFFQELTSRVITGELKHWVEKMVAKWNTINPIMLIICTWNQTRSVFGDQLNSLNLHCGTKASSLVPAWDVRLASRLW